MACNQSDSNRLNTHGIPSQVGSHCVLDSGVRVNESDPEPIPNEQYEFMHGTRESEEADAVDEILIEDNYTVNESQHPELTFGLIKRTKDVILQLKEQWQKSKEAKAELKAIRTQF